MQLLRPFRTMLVTPTAFLWRAAVATRARAPRPRAKAGQRRILLVSWEFPPSDATGAHLPASFARHATAAGWDISVVSGPQPRTVTKAGRALESCVPSGVNVHRVSRVLATEHHARMHPPKWSAPTIDGDYFTAVAMTHTVLDAIGDEPPAVVLATGPRFSNFVAARWLADAFDAKLVLQYRDEWTVNTPSFVKTSPDDLIEESRCLARADLIVFVSDGKRAAYQKAFPALKDDRIVTLPNGWEPFFHSNAVSDSTPTGLQDNRFTCVYTGRWHATLAPFIAAFTQVLERRQELQSRICITMIGNQLTENRLLIAEFQAKFPGALQVLSSVTPGAAIAAQRAAGALLLLNEHLYDGVIPIKTFDYLHSSRPILVFGCSGGAAELVRNLAAGIAVAADDDAALENAFDKLMGHPTDTWDTPTRRHWSAAHSREILTAKLLDQISRL